MLIVPLDDRFFSSTRGRIVALLRRGARTASDLVQALGLTDTAIRVHLATLERDGLVQRSGERRGAGKPAAAYGLTPAAERLFPRAYERALRGLLEALSEELPPEVLERAVREAGRRLAASLRRAPSGADSQARLAQALAFFSELGGLPEVTRRDGGTVLTSSSCPLAGVVADHPEVCLLAEALLSELLGAPVHQECPQGAPPRCAFQLPAASA
jgi:predicted ArsR family transcriptional regulator